MDFPSPLSFFFLPDFYVSLSILKQIKNFYPCPITYHLQHAAPKEIPGTHFHTCGDYSFQSKPSLIEMWEVPGLDGSRKAKAQHPGLSNMLLSIACTLLPADICSRSHPQATTVFYFQSPLYTLPERKIHSITPSAKIGSYRQGRNCVTRSIRHTMSSHSNLTSKGNAEALSIKI